MAAQGEGVFPGAPGIKLYYRWWRPTSRPAQAVLAAVHGREDPAGFCLGLSEHLVPHGYVLYLFDCRDLDRGPGDRGYLQDWGERLEDVRAFVRFTLAQEAGLPLFLVGNHAAALMVLSHAMHYPDGLTGVIAFEPAEPTPLRLSIPERLSRVLAGIWPIAPTPADPEPGPTAGMPAHDEADAHPSGCDRSMERMVTTWRELEPGADRLPAGQESLADIGVPHIIVHRTDSTEVGSPAELAGEIRTWLELHL